MTYIVIIDKSGRVEEKKVRQFQEENLYKEAGYKSATSFKKHCNWDYGESERISLYGKINGNAGKENKYEFPPPIDHLLLFGTIILVRYNINNMSTDLRKSDWVRFYEASMGGFETLDEEDSDDSSETNSVVLNKYGYENDGFVVDDDEEDIVEEDEEEEQIVIPKKVAKRKPSSKTIKKVMEEDNTNYMMDNENELVQEEYS